MTEVRGQLTIDTAPFLAGLASAFQQGAQRFAAFLSSLGARTIPIAVDVKTGDSKAQLDEVEASGKRLRDEFGKFIKADIDVDPAKKSLDELEQKGKSAGGGLSSALSFAAGNLLATGISNFTSLVGDAIAKGTQFQANLAELSAITGVTGPGLADLGQKARTMALEMGGSASGNVDAFKTILSRLGPDIAKSPEALDSMARSVATLSRATGDDAAASVDALTTGLLQFQVPLDDAGAAAAEMSKQMNVMAAGAKEGAAEVPQVAQAIKVAGVAASGAKVSFEETNAAIQVLAAGGKVGAEAGTALRNVLGKLGEGRFLPKEVQEELGKAGVDMKVLADTTIPLRDRLAELKKIQGDAALTTKLFGTENAAAANILIRGTDQIGVLTEKITGTNTATEQAATRMQTFAAQSELAQAAMADAALTLFEAIEPILTAGAQIGGVIAQGLGAVISTVSEGVGGLFSFIADNSGAFTILAAAIAAVAIASNAAAIGAGIYAAAQAISSAATSAASVVMGIFNGVLGANPIGAVVIAVAALAAGLAVLSNALEETTEEQLANAKAAQELNTKQQDLTRQEIQREKSVIGLIKAYKDLGSKANRTAADEKELGRIQNELNAQYPGLIDSTKSFSENLYSVANQALTSSKSIDKLTEKMKELEAQSKQIALQTAALESQQAFSEIFDAINEGSVDTEAVLRPYADAINKAKDDVSLTKAVNDLQSKIFSLQKGGDLEGEDALKAVGAANKFLEVRLRVLKLLRNEVEKPIDTPPPPKDDGTGGGTGGSDATDEAKKREEEAGRVRDRLAEINSQIKDVDEKRALLDKEGRARELQALKNDNDKKLRQIETDIGKEKNAEIKAALGRLKTATESSNTAALTAKLSELNKKGLEEYKKNLDESVKAQVEAAKTSEELILGNSADAVKRRSDLRSEQLRLALQRELNQIAEATPEFQEAFRRIDASFLEGRIDATQYRDQLDAALKAATPSVGEFQKTLVASGQELLDGTINAGVYRDRVKAAIEEAVKGSSDPATLRVALQRLANAGEKEMSETRKRLREQRLKDEETALLAITDLNARELARQVQDAQRAYDERIEVLDDAQARIEESLKTATDPAEVARFNEQILGIESARTDAEIELAAKRFEFEQDNLERTNDAYRAAAVLRTGLERLFTTDLTEEERKRLEADRDRVGKELQALKEKQAAGLIGAAEFNRQQLALEQQRVELAEKLEVRKLTFGSAINRGLTESFRKLREDEKTGLNKSLDDYIARQTKLAKAAAQQNRSTLGDSLGVGLELAKKNGEILLTQTGELLAAFVETGKFSFAELGKMAAQAAIDTVKQLIQIYTPQLILAASSLLGPIAGPIAAGVVLALVNGLIGSIKLAKKGEPMVKGGIRGRDSVPYLLAPGERVIDERANRKHFGLLQTIHEGKDPYAYLVARALREPTSFGKYAIAPGGAIVPREMVAMISVTRQESAAAMAMAGASNEKLDEILLELSTIRGASGRTATATETLATRKPPKPPGRPLP